MQQTYQTVLDKTILVPVVSQHSLRRERKMFRITGCLAVTYIGFAFGIIRENLFTVSDVCYQHNNDVISDVYGIMSLVECSTDCALHNCRSLLFDGNTHRCITYSANKTPTSGCGWKYAEMNTAKSSVECGVPGYSYDPYKDSCVVYCTTYGTTFTTYVGYAMASCNNLQLAKSSKQCMNVCIATTAFVCRSIDVSKSGRWCYLSEETAQTKPSNYKKYPNQFNYLHRNCA